MYQTALVPATTLSRRAGPVCMIRLAMRPAKSFWKKVQLWRTTCQWLCQRIRLVRLGGDGLVGDQGLQQQGHGPQHQQHGDHAQQLRPGLAQQRSRLVVGDQRDDAADEDRNGRIQHRHQEAGHEQRADEPARLARVMPIEGDEPRRRHRILRRRRRLEEALEEAK